MGFSLDTLSSLILSCYFLNNALRSSGDAVQRHTKSNSTNIIIHLHNTTEEEEEVEGEGDG